MKLVVIAGAGDYPKQMLAGITKAKEQNVGVLAIRGACPRSFLRGFSGPIFYNGVGEAGKSLEWIRREKFTHAIFAGQIPPTALFRTRFDSLAKALVGNLRVKCAHSIFGAIIETLEKEGIKVLPASTYMEDCIPCNPEVLTTRAPTERELADIERGHAAALTLGTIDIGQTVVVKDGMILAAEAFEGTNAAIKRGARLGGRGAVVVKAARQGHDNRFDIPVVGMKTMRVLAKRRIGALAFQAGRVLFFNREEAIDFANRHGIAIVVIDSGLPKL